MAGSWIWLTFGQAYPRHRWGPCSYCWHIMDTRYTRSAQLHPQKYQVSFKLLRIICLEVSEGLSCSKREEQTGAQWAQSPAGRKVSEHCGVGEALWAHQNPDTPESELHRGWPRCDQHTAEMKHPVGAGHAAGRLMPSVLPCLRT